MSFLKCQSDQLLPSMVVKGLQEEFQTTSPVDKAANHLAPTITPAIVLNSSWIECLGGPQIHQTSHQGLLSMYPPCHLWPHHHLSTFTWLSPTFTSRVGLLGLVPWETFLDPFRLSVPPLTTCSVLKLVTIRCTYLFTHLSRPLSV